MEMQISIEARELERFVPAYAVLPGAGLEPAQALPPEGF